MVSDLPVDIDHVTLRYWAVNRLLPAVLATAVYWYVAEATMLELGLFVGIFLVTLVAIDFYFDHELGV